MSRAPRVVLDTNVVLSALVFRTGELAALRMAWQAERFEPLADRATAGELVRVLAYPRFGLSDADRESLLADYLPWCRVVATPRRPPKVPECRDRADEAFLRLAITGRADCLVTGDKALLRAGKGFACPVIGAADFLREFV